MRKTVSKILRKFLQITFCSKINFGKVRTHSHSGGQPCLYHEFPKFLVSKSFQTSYAFDFHRHDIYQLVHFQIGSTLPSPHFPQESPLKVAKVYSEFKQPYRQSFWSTACITQVTFKSHGGSVGKGVRNSNKDRSRRLWVRAPVGAVIIFHSFLFLLKMPLRRCCSDRGHLRSVRISIPRPGYIWFQAGVLCAFRGANRVAPRARLRY